MVPGFPPLIWRYISLHLNLLKGTSKVALLNSALCAILLVIAEKVTVSGYLGLSWSFSSILIILSS